MHLGAQFAIADERPKQFLHMSENEMEMLVSQVLDSNLNYTLQFGIGLHHAGLKENDRALVEELFTNNKIQVKFQLPVQTLHFIQRRTQN